MWNSNLFTGVVVENFSYIFRLYGQATSVNREQMRLFKKAWAEFDTNQTGYIRRRDFVPFFAVSGRSFSASGRERERG
jgi:Ca2+-binding EF-hand superfamily protein